MAVLTLRQARQIVDACVARAEALGVQQSIAVVDASGNPITMDRMDGVRLLRDRFAEGKAFAAVFYQRPSGETAKQLDANPQLFFSALSMFPGRMFPVPGGFPITLDGEVVGGLGVSGATAEQDVEVALAGLEALKQMVETSATGG